MRHRQKIWPKILLTIVFWFGFFYLIFSTSPDAYSILHTPYSTVKIPITKIAFFTDLFLSLVLTFNLIFKSRKKALALSLFLTTFLFLKMLKVLNWLTVLLLFSLTAIMLLA